MSIKQMPGSGINIAIAERYRIIGCASHNENASLLAKKQAQNISQNLPIKSCGIYLSAGAK